MDTQKHISRIQRQIDQNDFTYVFDDIYDYLSLIKSAGVESSVKLLLPFLPALVENNVFSTIALLPSMVEIADRDRSKETKYAVLQAGTNLFGTIAKKTLEEHDQKAAESLSELVDELLQSGNRMAKKLIIESAIPFIPVISTVIKPDHAQFFAVSMIANTNGDSILNGKILDTSLSLLKKDAQAFKNSNTFFGNVESMLGSIWNSRELGKRIVTAALPFVDQYVREGHNPFYTIVALFHGARASAPLQKKLARTITDVLPEVADRNPKRATSILRAMSYDESRSERKPILTREFAHLGLIDPSLQRIWLIPASDRTPLVLGDYSCQPLDEFKKDYSEITRPDQSAALYEEADTISQVFTGAVTPKQAAKSILGKTGVEYMVLAL